MYAKSNIWIQVYWEGTNPFLHPSTHTHTPLIAVVLSTIGPALGVEWCRERLPFAETADVDIPGALL